MAEVREHLGHVPAEDGIVVDHQDTHRRWQLKQPRCHRDRAWKSVTYDGFLESVRAQRPQRSRSADKITCEIMRLDDATE
jgi:hypothetical protein